MRRRGHLSNVIAMKPSHVEDIRNKLKEAEACAGECNHMLILVETHEGVLRYFADDEITVAQVNWMVDRMKYQVLEKGWKA